MSEWKEAIIAEICFKVTDGAHHSPKEHKGYIPMFSVKDMEEQGFSYSSPKTISQEDYEKLIKGGCQPVINDILIAKDGSVMKHVFRVKEQPDYVLLSSIAILRPKQDIINSDFLVYALKTPRMNYNILKNYVSGTGVPRIVLKDFKKIAIAFPNLKEQIQIATTLSNLDQKITLLRQQNQDLEELAQTLFKRWFVEFEFPNENGAPYKSSGGKMIESELGEIPEGWNLSTIGENVDTLGGGTPSTTEPSYWENGDVLWYSPTDLTREKSVFSNGSTKKITPLGLQKSSAKLFPAYSLLMTSRATVGEITINTTEASTNQGFITLIPNKKLSLYFLYDWLKTKLSTVHSLASGSTFPEISKTDFRNMEVLIAKEKIHINFDNLVKPIYQSIENNTIEIQTLTQLRDILLPKLMSGEIRLNHD